MHKQLQRPRGLLFNSNAQLKQPFQRVQLQKFLPFLLHLPSPTLWEAAQMQKGHAGVSHHNKAHLARKSPPRRILDTKAVRGEEKCNSKGRGGLLWRRRLSAAGDRRRGR